MSDLSAKALTEDAEGCSRLRAVIAQDPGYAARAEEARSARVDGFASPLQTAPEGSTPCARLMVPDSQPSQPRTARSLSPLALVSAVLAFVASFQSLSAMTPRLPAP